MREVGKYTRFALHKQSLRPREEEKEREKEEKRESRRFLN